MRSDFVAGVSGHVCWRIPELRTDECLHRAQCAERMGDDAGDQLVGSIAVAHVERLLARGEVGEDEVRAVRECEPLQRGMELALAGELPAAREAYAAAATAGDRIAVAMALLLRGELFLHDAVDAGNEECLDAAAPIFDQLVRDYGGDEEAAVRVQVAKALNGAAGVHRARGETDAELAAYANVVSRFGRAAESPLRVQVARALMDQIVTERAVRNGNQSADREAFFRRFVGASEAQIREWTADMLKDEAIARAEDGHWTAAVEASDHVLGHLRGAGDDVGRRAIAWALMVKGGALEELGRDADARDAYGHVAERFRDDEAGELRALAAEAGRQQRRLARPRGFRRPRQIGPLTIAPPWIETRIEGPLGHWPRFGWAIIAIAVAAAALGLPGGRRLLSALEDYGHAVEARAHVVESIGVVALAIGMGALAVCWLVQLGLVVLRGRRDHVVFVLLCPLVLAAYVAIVRLAGWPSLFLD